MSCSHSVVFLLDTASPGPRARLQRGALRLLTQLCSRFGLPRLRWAFRFFDSLGGRGGASRGGGFRPPGPRAWARFEEELAERFGARGVGSGLPGPASRAALTHHGLKETLLDFQWDRPEIASPTKPLRRSRRTGPAAAEPPESRAPPEGFVNAVFLFSPCPRSRRDLRRFVSGSHAAASPADPPAAQELAEKLLPKSVQELIAEQRIALFWVDTAECAQVMESPDHVGYWTILELICQTGGTILPADTLVHFLSPHNFDTSSPVPQSIPWTTLLPLDATLNCLFLKPSVLQTVFPQQEGTLFLRGKKQESCPVILEPLAMSQRQLHCPVNIFLKGSLSGWSLAQAGHFLTESWILQSSQAEQAEHNRSLFQQLLRTLVTEELHMVAEVLLSTSWCSCTAVLSPLSESTAVLTVLGTEKTAEGQRCNLEGDVVENCPQNHDFHLPDVVNSVLSKIDTVVEDSLASMEEAPVPEWVERELSHTGGWHPSVLEAWYPTSNACGASSDLMESFRLLQVPCASKKDDVDQSEVELLESLSELYQRKSSETSAAAGPGNSRKRRGVPRTPVRQKMKTMSRSLQMLNVARLNVKAQKLQPDGEPPTVNEKVPWKLSAKRLNEKVEEKEKALKLSIDFKTEEELQSHLIASYQKAVAEGVLSSVCAQDMIMAIKRFLKIQDAKEKEVACVERVRNHLLKTSKVLRQQHGSQKEAKVRECRLQVFLRLELCLQCSSLQSNTDEMEQLLEEMTDMLRILCLTEDSGYLTKFLEEILELYMNSMPKTLGDIYYGLGTQIPAKLASVLPSDFFSDDSVTLDSKSPSLPLSLSSALTPTAVCLPSESDQLEELRTRSAKKRRKNVLARHRSMTEAPQNLRQIEIPKTAKIPIRKESLRSYLASEKLQQMPSLQKEAVQEVTKVRRNLFNEEILSPSKRSMKKMPRSQSVSAVEGLRYKCSDEGTKDHRKLLTKRVAETPLHKQVSRRLLQKQIKGRSSDPGCDTGVVEESPEKAINEAGLRRSPRIKQLSLNRTCSGVFYSTTQPSSQDSQLVHQGQEEENSTLQDVEGMKQHSQSAPVQTPKSLFFGAVIDTCSPAVNPSPGRRRTRKDSLHSEELTACQTPRKTPHKPAQKPVSSASKLPRRSPRILHRTPQRMEEIHGKSPAAKKSAVKCLGKYFSHPAQRVKSPSALAESKSVHLLQGTSEDFSSAERLSPPCKEAGFPMPERKGFTELSDSLLPLTDSNPAASPSCAMQERCSTELQTPRRSLRYLSKLASPVGTRRQILPKEIQVQSDPLSRGTKNTPRKPEDPGSELCTSPPSTEIAELAVRLEPPFSSLSECSMDSVITCSPSHVEAKESDWELCASKPQRSPSIAGTPLRSLLHKSKQAKCELSPGREKLIVAFATPENKDNRHDGDNSSVESLQLCQFQAPQNIPVLETNKQMEVVSQKFSPREDSENLGKNLSPKPSAGVQVHAQNAEREGEQWFKEGNSSANTHESFLSGSQTVSEDLEPKTLKEEYTGLKAPRLKRHSRFALNTSPPVPKSPPAYSLRCTADRRQREAAARMGEPQLLAKFSTPKSHCKLPSASPPTYEVELEMQASGLPKLRIKKIGSCTSLEVQPEASASKPKGGESPFGELAATWCSKHPGKLAAACVSPSCFRSFHSTPGKGAGQTYICQSYTPTSCASNTSPSPLEAGVSWTPSPKQKGKTTPDAINDWPRRKRAAGSTANVSCSQSERNAEEWKTMSAGREVKILEHCSSKGANTLEEFEVEGVCRLQDLASPGDSEPKADEDSAKGTFGLKMRKRVLMYLSPEKEESHDTKRPCTDRCSVDLSGSPSDDGSRSKSRLDSVLPEKPGSCTFMTLEQHSHTGDDDVFLLSGSTPPVKSTLSASSLVALTQSPLLCQGQTPPPWRKCVQEESDAFQIAANQELSPLHIPAFRKRPLSRTYSRKKLLS
ncbi:treslin isoform X2 [Melopsittacus undulatus]|uniref:treslin isoform X2 n=1 Tax=Melopsittacus undulatus TaxID=13146 RepID=UPI00146F20ED|nr:treslin isoform X2 [Melopsittacus undulatus]